MPESLDANANGSKVLSSASAELSSRSDVKLPEIERHTVRVEIESGKGVIRLDPDTITSLEKRIKRLIKETIKRDADQSSEKKARDNYKCVCPEGSFVAFRNAGEIVKRIELGVARVKLTKETDVLEVVELLDREGKKISLPQVAKIPGIEILKPNAKPSVEVAKPVVKAAPNANEIRFEDVDLPALGGGPAGPTNAKSPEVFSKVQRSNGKSEAIRGAVSRQSKLDFKVTQEVESALRELLEAKAREINAKLATEGKKGLSWAGALLEVVHKNEGKPENEGKFLAAEMIDKILDPLRPVDQTRRLDVCAFCEEAVKNASGIGWGRQRQLSSTVKPYLKVLLARFGEQSEEQELGTVYSNVTLEQALAKLDPSIPMAVQTRVIQERIPEIIKRELGTRPNDQGKRVAHTKRLDAAIKKVQASPAYQALQSKTRKDLNGRYSNLAHRVNRDQSAKPGAGSKHGNSGQNAPKR